MGTFTKPLLDIICLSIYLFHFTFVHEYPVLVMSQVTHKTQQGAQTALNIPCERKKMADVSMTSYTC